MNDQIIVRMDAEGQTYINKQLIPRDRVRGRLREALTGRQTKVVFFAADGELEYDKVADFMDVCRDNGAENLGIVFDDLRGGRRRRRRGRSVEPAASGTDQTIQAILHGPSLSQGEGFVFEAAFLGVFRVRRSPEGVPDAAQELVDGLRRERNEQHRQAPDAELPVEDEQLQVLGIDLEAAADGLDGALAVLGQQAACAPGSGSSPPGRTPP